MLNIPFLLIPMKFYPFTLKQKAVKDTTFEVEENHKLVKKIVACLI
jgi:hypothetical protein